MLNVIKRSELCSVCRFYATCNKLDCKIYQNLVNGYYAELKERIENAIKFAEDAGTTEVIDALKNGLKYVSDSENKQ